MVARVPIDRIAFVAGGVLLLVGLGAYVATDFASLTALIPAAIGTLFILLGVARRDARYERRAAIGIIGVAIVAILGALMGLPEVIDLIKGESVESTTRAISQGVLVVVGLAVLLVVGRDLLADR